jgi:hypothetical protein
MVSLGSYSDFSFKSNSKDIWSSGRNVSDFTRSYVIGLGFVGAACTTNRYAIAEEHGGFFLTGVCFIFGISFQLVLKFS